MSKEVARIYKSLVRQGRDITACSLHRMLARTRKLTGDMTGIYRQAKLVEYYISQRLYSITGATSEDASTSTTIQPWRGEGCSATNRELTLESVLNTYHPILENLTRYLETRDLILLANTCSTLHRLLYSYGPAWEFLDFSTQMSENRRRELLTNRRKIGYTLQNRALYPDVGFTSELALELLFKIPLTHLRYLAFDGTDINDAALRLYLTKGRSTLEYVSIRDCGHINPGELLAYFSRLQDVGFPRALKKLELRGIPGVLRLSKPSGYLDGESDLGHDIKGLFKVLRELKIPIDVGFCVISLDFCQTIQRNYPHATVGDKVIGVRERRRCAICNEASSEAFCMHCENERTCMTCKELGETTWLCRKCEPGSWEGVAWPYICECGRILCPVCFPRFAVSFHDCPCYECYECHQDPYLLPVQRIAVRRYRCDHCGLDKCSFCWEDSGIKMKKCIECDRSLCEICGVILSCTDCNACVCENCYNATEYPIVVQGRDWHCEYCRGKVDDSSSDSTINDHSNCVTCAHFGKEGQTYSTALCECDSSPVLEAAQTTRPPYANGDGEKQALRENPWIVAKRRRRSTDNTETPDSQSIAKRFRLEKKTSTTSHGAK